MLANRLHRVLVQANYMLQFPIRIRRDKIRGTRPYIGRINSPEQVDLWRENGGVLINYNPKLRDDTHDAVFFSEAPFFVSAFDRDPAIVVVYRPPSWRAHRKELPSYFPKESTCRLILRTINGAGLSEWGAELCDGLGFDTDGLTSITDIELRERLGLQREQLSRAKDRILYGFAQSYFMAIPIVRNVPPADETLLPIYEHIGRLRQVRGLHIAVDGELHKTHRFWKVALRRLARCGSITLKDRIGIYMPSEIKPDFALIREKHTGAMQDLEKLIETVDNAPMLTPGRLEDFIRGKNAYTKDS